MTKIKWDQVGTRRFETGVDHGVLYLPTNGVYSTGVPWNGLTTVTESPSGAETSAQYADNIKYLNLQSAEEFGATIEALYYPDEFGQCDGTAEPEPGVYIGQQSRSVFGFSYRTLVGNDVQGQNLGYKLHLVYNCLAAPSEKAYATVSDSPEAMPFSWEVTTTSVEVGTIGGTEYNPTATLTIDSTKVAPDRLAALEDLLYGTSGADPELPMPGTVIALFSGAVSTVSTQAPTYNPTTDTVTVPTIAGVNYFVDGEPVAGSFTITETTVVEARPADGYRFSDTSDTDWTINFV